jgi:hypothetical protein
MNYPVQQSLNYVSNNKNTGESPMFKKLIILAVTILAFSNISCSASNKTTSVNYKLVKKSKIGKLPEFNLTEQPMYCADFMLLTIRPNWLEWYKNEFKKAKDLGYNAISLIARADIYYTSTVNETKKTKKQQQVEELYKYAINELDVDVIPQLFVLARGNRCFSRQLQKKYPDLIIKGKMSASSAIWNPLFRFPDGKDIYTKVIFPLIDKIIAFYGDKKPRFFHLGFDELDKVALKKLADKVGMSPEQVMANELNRITGYLLAKGITPIIWGDMFLSKKLAESNYGLKNVKTNPNFMTLPSIHGGIETKDFLGALDVVESLKYITNKDKIIIFDWHYTNATVDSSYPSIDFFQQLGFRNVLGTTWYNENGIKAFSKYVAQKKGGGMVASFWHHVLPSSSKLDETYKKTINNSIIYFKNPAYKLHQSPAINISKIVLGENDLEKISLELNDPPLSTKSYLLMRKYKINNKKYQHPKYDKQVLLHTKQVQGKTVLSAEFKPSDYGFKNGDLIDLKFNYYTKDKFYQSSEKEAAIIISGKKVKKITAKANNPEKDLLYGIDFNSNNIIDGKYIISQGLTPHIGFYTGKITNNALKGRLYFAEDTTYGTIVNNQMTVDLTIKFNDISDNSPKAILSWGQWNKGVRIFIWGDKIEFQAGYYGTPIRLKSFTIKKNTIYNVRTISDYKKKKISLYINKKLVRSKQLKYPYSFNSGEQDLSNFKVSVGCAFRKDKPSYFLDNAEIKDIKIWNKAVYYSK